VLLNINKSIIHLLEQVQRRASRKIQEYRGWSYRFIHEANLFYMNVNSSHELYHTKHQVAPHLQKMLLYKIIIFTQFSVVDPPYIIYFLVTTYIQGDELFCWRQLKVMSSTKKVIFK